MWPRRGGQGAYRKWLDDELVARFVDAVGDGEVWGRKWAVYNTLKSLAIFCEVNSLSPSKLVERLKDDGDSRELWERFLVALRRRGVKGTSVKNFIVGIRNFLDYYEVLDNVNWEQVNRLKRKLFSGSLSKNIYARSEGELTKPLIRRILLQSCKSARDRALVLLLASSGISFGDALNLNVGDIENLWGEQDCYMIQYLRKKTATKATTFITKECRDWILEYLRERERKGEKIGPKSPLFVSYFGHEPKRMSYVRGVYIMRRLFDNAGLSEEIGVDAAGRKRYKYHTHLFRKYFRTALRNAGVDRIYVEAMMGHDIHSMFGIEMVYDKQADKPEVLMEQYRRALHELTFLEQAEGQVVTAEELERLVQRIKELEAKVKILQMLDRNVMERSSRKNSDRKKRRW
mgnify:CR=1 FL=1